MSQLAEVRSAPVSPSVAGGSRGLVRWVCTSNPFYVLSALLVCLGLRVSFGAQVEASHTWALLFGMAGYTLLLAVTACLLVRFVGVWDDVRTVLLLVVLMFLATSVTFDEVLARTPSRGVACYVLGLAFAVAVSEGMLRGIRLTLPALFRGPYYLLLALFFLYPVALTPLLDRPRSEALSWALFGFAPAAGLAFLTLIPAARRGRGYVRDNGSPWPWAWYPWVLFGVLGFGVGARSALLCWSMHHVQRAEAEPYIFGPYFLVPFLLAVGVVLLEVGLVERLGRVVAAALAVPPVLVVLAAVGHRPEPLYQGFLTSFVARLGGTPLFLSVVAAAGFYAYAMLRRVPAAAEALTAALAALAVVAPESLGWHDRVAPQAAPVLAIGVLQLGLGLRDRRAWRCLLGAGGLAASVAIALPHVSGPLAPYRGPIAFHLGLAAAWAAGAAFDDAVGRLLRGVGAALALAAGLAVLSGRAEGVPEWAEDVYPLAMAALVAGYGRRLGHRPSLAVAGVIATAWAGAVGWRGYRLLRLVVVGLDCLMLGMVFFALAVLTSAVKGGVVPWKGVGGKREAPDSLA